MKVVFLDRDGVINEFPGNGNYVTKVKNFHFIKNSLKALKILTEKGYTIFVVSNQAGVSKGVYTKEKLDQINTYMLKEIRNAGGEIKKVFYCIHRSDQACDCRKPEIGSIEKALRSIDKKLDQAKKAFFIGDTKIDILAGHNAGCKTIFVLSGREGRFDIKKWELQPDYIVKDLLEATKLIIHENSNHTRLSGRRASKSSRSAV